MSEIQADEAGRFGEYGGRYVPETLIPALDELNENWNQLANNNAYWEALRDDLKNFAGRPTAVTFAPGLTELFDGADVWLKREDLLHTGAHKLNNTLGQVRLAKMMGKTRVIAETGAGQHGVATAVACARMGLVCEVFMGAQDVARQQPNVDRMELFGAKVRPVQSGSRTLKDAMNAAIRDWVANVETTFYCIGSVAGPHPYPTIVRELQRVIGDEARAQIIEETGALPDAVIACIGGGSNAMGIYTAFLNDESVRLVGVEAGGHGLGTGMHGASLTLGKTGVLHGSASLILQNDDGQIAEAHSVSAGLDYPGVGPQLAALRDTGRVEVLSATDEEALDAFQLMCRAEGILPALESSHAIAGAARLAKELGKGKVLLVNLSGRGDKDLTHALQQIQTMNASRKDRP